MTPGYTNHRTTPKHRTIYIPFEIKIRDMAKTIAKCEKDNRWRDGGFPLETSWYDRQTYEKEVGESDYSI